MSFPSSVRLCVCQHFNINLKFRKTVSGVQYQRSNEVVFVDLDILPEPPDNLPWFLVIQLLQLSD